MTMKQLAHCTAFAGTRRIASGVLAQVAAQAREALDRDGEAAILVFDDATAQVVEVDLRGTVVEVAARYVGGAGREAAVADTAGQPPRGPGRPKLGVVAREVTLLPRHWEWLAGQPGGASVALRKLVEEASRASAGKDAVRRAQEAAYRFLSVMAGDLPDYEEATRALFAGNRVQFSERVAAWPADVRDYVLALADAAFAEPLHVS